MVKNVNRFLGEQPVFVVDVLNYLLYILFFFEIIGVIIVVYHEDREVGRGMKKIFFVLLLIISVTLLFLGARYWYIKDNFTMSYKVAEKVTQEALQDHSHSDYMISEEEWELHSKDSVYDLVREPFNWDEFKEFVQTCEKHSQSSLLYSDGKASYQVMKNSYQETHNSIYLDCVDYSKENNDVIGRNQIGLLLEKVNGGAWKVVGQYRNEDSTTHDEISALAAATDFVTAIKEKNTAHLLELLKKPHFFYSDYDINHADKVFEGFEKNFDLNSLEVELYNDGYAMHADAGQYEFFITDKKGHDFEQVNSLIIHFEENGETMYYYHPYIRYFPFAEEMVEKYLELITRKSVAELADFMNPDDIVVPEWVAEETIKNYSDYFGDQNLTVRYDLGFIYTIENSVGKEHQLEVIYGDGSMAIKDEFAPDFEY